MQKVSKKRNNVYRRTYTKNVPKRVFMCVTKTPQLRLQLCLLIVPVSCKLNIRSKYLLDFTVQVSSELDQKPYIISLCLSSKSALSPDANKWLECGGSNEVFFVKRTASEVILLWYHFTFSVCNVSREFRNSCTSLIETIVYYAHKGSHTVFELMTDQMSYGECNFFRWVEKSISRVNHGALKCFHFYKNCTCTVHTSF